MRTILVQISNDYLQGMGVGSGGATRAMARPRFRAVGPKYVLARPRFRSKFQIIRLLLCHLIKSQIR